MYHYPPKYTFPCRQLSFDTRAPSAMLFATPSPQTLPVLLSLPSVLRALTPETWPSLLHRRMLNALQLRGFLVLLLVVE